MAHSYLPPAKLELILITRLAGKTLQIKAKSLFNNPGTQTLLHCIIALTAPTATLCESFFIKAGTLSIASVSYTHLTLPTKRIV